MTLPRVQEYDPPPLPTGKLTVVVEFQRQDVDDFTLGMVRTERTGRSRIIIEGLDEYVRPYIEEVIGVLDTQQDELTDLSIE